MQKIAGAMPSKKLPARKTPTEDLALVRVFKENLRALVAALRAGAPAGQHLTQKELAKRLRISLRNFKNLIEGNHAPTLRTIESIAQGLQVDPWQLFVPGLRTELVLDPQLRGKTKETIQLYLQSPEHASLFERIAALPGSSKH